VGAADSAIGEANVPAAAAFADCDGDLAAATTQRERSRDLRLREDNRDKQMTKAPSTLTFFRLLIGSTLSLLHCLLGN